MLKAITDQLRAYVPVGEQEQADLRMILRAVEQFPDVLERSCELAHLTASCWIVNPDRSRVLMAYHNLYRSWSWLGGHADGDADLLAVALREAQEESGAAHVQPVSTEIFSVEVLNVEAHHRRGVYVPSHLHLNVTYLLEDDDSDRLRAKPDENSAVRWFSADEVLSAVSEPCMLPIYGKLLERVKNL